MPPSEFSLRLQHGITGGFIPAMPSEIHTITGSPSQPHLQVASCVRQTDSPALKDPESKSLPKGDKHDALVEELHSILKKLPTEDPPGSEDIYKMDTSIAWGSEDLMWMNGGPAGCNRGTSQRQPTAEDEAKFKRAVEIVKVLVNEAK